MHFEVRDIAKTKLPTNQYFLYFLKAMFENHKHWYMICYDWT